MSPHVSEDALILLHYGENDDRAADRHLEECPACRRALQVLAGDLDQFGSFRVPEREERYGEVVWRQLAPKLSSRPRKRSRLAIPLLAALILAGTFLAGRLSTRWTDTGNPAAIRERILLVALGEHLDRSRMLLIELTNARPGDYQRQSARQLLRESRLYRQSASGVLDVASTDLLDELERLLIDVSHSSGSEDELMTRIEERDVLFKIRMLQDGVRLRQRF